MRRNDQYIIQQIKNKVLAKNPDAEIILYGSHARGEATPESDWDILVLLNTENVTKKMEQEYRHSLFDLELEISEPISIFVYSREKWESSIHSPFFRSVSREGIRL